MNPLLIYFTDLTHVGNGVATESIPLPVGIVASYVRKTFGGDVEVKLFKYPDSLREAVLQRLPDVLACSNYSWNSNLSYYFCEWIKSIRRDILTVFGGPNYPFHAKAQEDFLRARPAVDIHVFQQGEGAFAEVVRRVLSGENNRGILGEPIAGCQFIDPSTREFRNGPPVPRIRDLDSIPSPYVSGLLDNFFDGQLTPLVETSRGCPFSCNFCNVADPYFNKVDIFSDEYVHEELTYIAKRASRIGVGHLTFADNNFGMLARDENIAMLLNELRREYGWPRSLSVPLGKSPKERVVRATRVLGDLITVSMTVQSMDEAVLANIKRKNLPLESYRKLMDELEAEGRPTHAEVIVPLPEETFESYISGINALLDLNVTQIICHTLQMNHGTPYKDDPDYRVKYGFVTKYRVVPLDFSKMDARYVLDTEEVAVASNTMSYEEYVQARRHQFVVDLCCNSRVFDSLRKYLVSKGAKQSGWIETIWRESASYPGRVRRVFDSFEKETRSELWDSERELIAYYSEAENYEKLLSYERGGNVLYKHRILMFSECPEEWIQVVFRVAEELLIGDSRGEAAGTTGEEIRAIKDYVSCLLWGGLSQDALDQPVVKDFSYDVLGWSRRPGRTDLCEYVAKRPVKLRFGFPEESVGVMRDAFKRYGTDLAGLAKLMQRVKASSYIRRVWYESEIDRESGA